MRTRIPPTLSFTALALVIGVTGSHIAYGNDATIPQPNVSIAYIDNPSEKRERISNNPDVIQKKMLATKLRLVNGLGMQREVLQKELLKQESTDAWQTDDTMPDDARIAACMKQWDHRNVEICDDFAEAIVNGEEIPMDYLPEDIEFPPAKVMTAQAGN